MIACVIASFLVSWTPNHCLTFSIYLMGKSNMPEWMFYWNSVTQVIHRGTQLQKLLLVEEFFPRSWKFY